MTTPISSRRDVRGVPLSTIASELGGAAAGVSIEGDASVRVRDVQQDSRRIVAGDLFVARTGSSGAAASARFTADALARGASAIMCASGDPTPPTALPVLRVPPGQLRSALGIAASTVHGHPSYVVEVLGVTGTNGKTTTTWMLADALDRLAAARGRPADCAVIGTVGARLGSERRPTTHTTPEGDELARLLAWSRDRGAAHAAIEISSHALEQGRLGGTRIRAAAFTNLTQDHLDYHHTMEAYFEAKSRLFHELHPGVAIVWIDDPWGARLADSLRTPKLTIGRAAGADVRITGAGFSSVGIEAELQTPAGPIALRSRLIGDHNLANLSIALGVLIGLGIPAGEAAAALGAAPPVAGRLEVASDAAQDDVTVLVDYAHTPDALARVLQALRPLTKGRLICLFGCGGDRDTAKRAPMGQAVADAADVAIATSDNPRTEDPAAIVAAILTGMTALPRLDADALPTATRGVHVEVDRGAAIARAIESAAPGDVVLLAGKGHEDYQIIGTEKRPFDDVAEARRALSLRRQRGRG
jgi:UDP-N-acetylmuramoyl-L-alanyl-D-glutamate--2,6-diaminopimelate ligase